MQQCERYFPVVVQQALRVLAGGIDVEPMHEIPPSLAQRFRSDACWSVGRAGTKVLVLEGAERDACDKPGGYAIWFPQQGSTSELEALDRNPDAVASHSADAVRLTLQWWLRAMKPN